MIATNHALTGALIGLTVHQPLLAISAALASHFICDAIPHYGSSDKNRVRTAGFARYLLIDAAVCGLLVAALLVTSPTNWLLPAICAFMATAPDFAWLPGYLRVRRGASQFKVSNVFTRFAKDIQWFERPIGALVEAGWLVGSVTLLVAYLTAV